LNTSVGVLDSCALGPSYLWRKRGVCFDCIMLPITKIRRLIDQHAYTNLYLITDQKNTEAKPTQESDINLIHVLSDPSFTQLKYVNKYFRCTGEYT